MILQESTGIAKVFFSMAVFENLYENPDHAREVTGSSPVTPIYSIVFLVASSAIILSLTMSSLPEPSIGRASTLK